MVNTKTIKFVLNADAGATLPGSATGGRPKSSKALGVQDHNVLPKDGGAAQPSAHKDTEAWNEVTEFL